MNRELRADMLSQGARNISRLRRERDKMDRELRIDTMAQVIFRHRDPAAAARDPFDYSAADRAEAERFIDMLDADRCNCPCRSGALLPPAGLGFYDGSLLR